MFRYKLRTLLVLLAIGPPMLAGILLPMQRAIEHHRQRNACSDYLKQIGLSLHNYSGDEIWLRLPDSRPAYMADVPLEPSAAPLDRED